jgi:hypothetical protein
MPTPTPMPIFSPVVSPGTVEPLSPGSDVFVEEGELVVVVVAGPLWVEVEIVDSVSEPGVEVGVCLGVDDDDDGDDSVESRLSSCKLRVPAGRPYVQVKKDLVAGEL